MGPRPNSGSRWVPMPQEGLILSDYNQMVRTPTGKEIHGMKTRRLSTILTSAYLSAMLASSVSPVRSDATFAATIDPTAARQAFQSAVNGLEATNWMAASATPSVSEPAPKVILVNNPAPKTDPTMTPELMARLIVFTQSVDKIGALNAPVCKILNLCDGTQNMPLKYCVSDSTDGEHFFGLRPDGGTKDILIVVRHGALMETYLTDKSGKLRAAAIQENGATRLIPNEKAAEKFKQEMTLFAGEAGALPPSGTALAGNS